MSHVDLRRCCNEALAALSGEIEIKASDIVIPANLRNDLLDPGLIAEAFDPVAVRDEGIPRITACVDNGVLVDPDAQREEPFAQEQPDALDRIAFR